MDDLEKRKIYNFIQLALQSFQSNKFQINTYSPYYAVNGTSGIKFSVKLNETDLAFFAGFSTDKKYEGKLLFGILKSESNEKIKKLNLDEDENGNKIQEKFKIDEKFLTANEETQKEKISKWLNEQIKVILFLNKIVNVSYEKVGFVRWFVFVELPWLSFLGTAIYVGIMSNLKNNQAYFPTSCLIVVSISFFMILFTIGFKKKIRKTKGIKYSWNPWSWAVSYTAKTVAFLCFFPILFIPYIPKIVKWILFFPLKLFSKPCDKCGAYFSKEIIEREELGCQSGYATVTRHDITRNTKGEKYLRQIDLNKSM